LGEAGDQPVFFLIVDGQRFEGFYCGDGQYKVRFMPKSMGVWSYVTTSSIAQLDGQAGEFTCVEPSEARIGYEPQTFPNWWSDCLSPDLAEGEHRGAKTVSRWREQFLRDFQRRLDRCLQTV
jgi:hypothetical protein